MSQRSRLSGSLLKVLYRSFQTRVVEKWLLPYFFSPQRIQDSTLYESIRLDHETSPVQSETKLLLKRVWFHASSVGELESLMPMIEVLNDQGCELILTILSESARNALKDLVFKLQKKPSRVLFSGYAPWEGHWLEAFKKYHPTLFVTAKYEAWPDLWVSLQQTGVPLAMISVHARRSIRLARILCSWMQGAMPTLYLFSCREDEVSKLKRLFPKAEVQSVGEPRWDRVFQRSQVGNSRARVLMQGAQALKRPWGVIGSAWIEDLEFIGRKLQDFEGSLWIVPHHVDPKTCENIEAHLKKMGLSCVRTAELTQLPEGTSIVLVNEMGFLAELYSKSDWVWVGGGFGAGVHSTIEPALYGIPIAAGSKGSEKFTEIEELVSLGQLQMIDVQSDLCSWWDDLKTGKFSKFREKWKSEAQIKLGATQKIVSALVKIK